MPELLDPALPDRSATGAEPTAAPPGFWERLDEWWVGRSRILRPEHSIPVKIVLSIYEFFSSLSLAVFLILSAAFTQGVATFVEAAYGTPAAQFGIYQSWWFVALLVLLAINIFCAASIRYPWKRYQTGFVVTHIGLLVLLGGTALSRIYGVDAQVQIFEGGTGSIAQEVDSLDFREWLRNDGDEKAAALGTPGTALPPVSFNPGPFNWADYDRDFAFTRPRELDKFTTWERWKSVPGRFCRWVSGGLFRAARPSGFTFERDGVRVEVLDYSADAEIVPVPSIDVRLGMARDVTDEATGRTEQGPVAFMPAMNLGVRESRTRPELFPHGVGESQALGGGKLVFWLAGTPERVAAFKLGVPEGDCTPRGQVVVVVAGKAYRLQVSDNLPSPPQPLGDTGLTCQIAYCSAPLEGGITDNPVVGLKIAGPTAAAKETPLQVWADDPHVSMHDYGRKLYVEYWYDRGPLQPEQVKQGLGGTRFDILQTPDSKLLYRSWNGHKIIAAGELTVGSAQEAIDAFKMPRATVKLYLSEHRGGSKLEYAAKPIAFRRGDMQARKRQAAKVRMTVDGQSEEFWIAAHMIDPTLEEADPRDLTKLKSATFERRTVTNAEKKKSASLALMFKTEPIGFRVKLIEFERKLDPGTSQPSHYSSTVDFLELNRDRHLRQLPLGGDSPANVLVKELKSAQRIAVHPRTARVYWIDPARGILAGSPDKPEGAETVVSHARHGLAQPVALALDAEHDWLYWADAEGGAIGRASLTKDLVEPMIVATPRPEWLALDAKAGHVYWADRREKAIGRADLDGQNPAKRLIVGVERPGGLALDTEKKTIYWTDLADGVIRSAAFDGTNRELVYQPKDLKEHAAGELACDETTHTLYWIDTAARQLMRREADAKGEPVTAVAHLPDAKGLSLAGNKLWWTESAEMRSKVWITMNAPVDVTNPLNGRSYRLFQESFGGPIKAGTPEFEQIVPPDVDKSELYFSVLTVNYDPGRGIWQIGCLLIVAGITIMFYMRAYFFMPGFRAEGSSE